MTKLEKTEKGYKISGGFSTKNKEDRDLLKSLHPIREVNSLKSSIGKTEVETKKILSQTEAKKLKKAEQVLLLKSLGAKEIPKYEADRVALIMRLQ